MVTGNLSTRLENLSLREKGKVYGKVRVIIIVDDMSLAFPMDLLPIDWSAQIG